jgi:hypothetical protein
MYIVLTRHTQEYCGENQPFSIDFSNVQDVDSPAVFNQSEAQVLKLTLRKYFSVETTNQLIGQLAGCDAAVLESTHLIREVLEGKVRYSLIQEVKNLTVQCDDRTLSVESYPLIMAEIFEV